MRPITAGTAAPEIPGIESNGPRVLVFYKVTCPVCELAAPKLGAFAGAHPGRVRGIGQDPAPKLVEFERRFGMDVGSISEQPPYAMSNAFGVRTVPTTFLIDEAGDIVDAVEGWDRDGLNALTRRLADLAGEPYDPVSDPADGLPTYRPG